MAHQTLLLTSSSLFMITVFLPYFFQSYSHANCSPSACGIIPNISSPFRLKDSPSNCGDRRFELACENNVTSLYLQSQRYYVRAINYENSTIRLVDASINNSNTCSFPNSSAYDYNFSYPYPQSYPYTTMITSSTNQYVYVASSPIHFISCPYQLKNNPSLFTDITHDCAPFSSQSQSHPRFTYIKVGHMKASEVPQTCRVEVVVMTSFKFNDSNNNVSLSDIHHSLVYGFELFLCPDCGSSAWDNFIGFFKAYGLVLIPLAIVVVITAGVSLPLMIIIAFVSLLILTFINFGWIENWTFILGQLFIDGVVFKPNYSFLAIIISTIIGAPRVFICPVLVLWLAVYKFRRRHMSTFDVIETFLQSNNKLAPIRYSYSDLKKMTNGFQDELGKGGYGSVYKGKLRSGILVAVKLLKNSGASGQDFINEISTIGRVHHVNVVKLVGYCAEGSKRALVFDFMINGSLDKYIFNQEILNSLNWDTKFDVAIGVARGIEYLHRGCDVQILHFDIKPHNILLDDKFIPKISDFGLAKFCSTDKNTVTLTAARGTIGYVAPELINRGIGQVSYKADVYSFGMLLIEMVGIKRDLRGNNDDSSKYFPCWIYDHFNQEKDIETGNVDESYISDGNDSSQRLVRKMTIVALWCIQMNPNDRPTMNEVLKMLEGEVEQLQIPDYPSQTPYIAPDEDESWGVSSTDYDSVSLLHQDNAPSVEIKYF